MSDVGETRTNRITGETRVFDGQNWRVLNNSVSNASGAGGKFNDTLDRLAAQNVSASRDNASGALSRIEEAGDLIGAIQNNQMPSGFTAPLRLKAGGLGYSRNQTANLRNLDRFAGTAAIGSAAALKPLSNSDMAFLMQQQAGSRENEQTNLRFLQARQWADAKMLGKSAAQDEWIQRLGSPNAMNGRGQSFNTWWATVENQMYPPPNVNTQGSYRPPARQQGNQRNSAPVQAPSRVRTYNPQTGRIE